ncbi:MAG: hypothetical protein V4812_14515 [Pseudomonadota bacterium]
MKPLIAIVLCLSLAACDKAPEEGSALTTSADGSLYTNARFGLSVSKPEGWYAMDIKESMAQMQKGGAMMAGSDENMQAMMDASMKSTLPLFNFFEAPPGAAVKTNANIGAAAENVEALPGIKTGCDYLYQMKQLMAQSPLKIDFSQECQSIRINGNPFGMHSATMSVGNNEVKQRYYACIKDRHALVLVHSYTEDKGDETLNQVMETLKLGCDA